ncbi:MAG: PfkB family carbohydrate kinase [Candidatus Limivicinus sp.]|jgi:pseudouridine kinase
MESIKNPLKPNHSAVVIGGVNMDIGGKSAAGLILRDSNPGVITAKPGGVGRNIAHNLKLLGLDVSLIAAVGGDIYGSAIMDSCRSLNIDMSMSPVLPDRRSSAYLYVADETGEMHVGIADMDITKCITPEYLEKYIDRINGFDAVVVDANLDVPAIEYLAEHCTAPMYSDPVSTAKAPRLKKLLPRLVALKPNAMEAETLTGEKDMEKAAGALLNAGVKRVFISLSEQGILAAEGNKIIRMPCETREIVNTTGAGDAVAAAVTWAGINNMSLEDTLRTAIRAGAITCRSEYANCSELSELTKI